MRSLPAISSLLLLAAAACSKVPGDIIRPDDMAALMADVHVGEAVVEMNRTTFYNDSLRQAMKQSVLLRHSVTTEQFDSSLAWYGRHIDVYMEVYDATIERLEHRLIESGNRIAGDNALSIAGDSVDVWPDARYLAVSDRSPSRLVAFNFPRDPNWERGDRYVWRAKFVNATEKSEWLIGAEYADGDVEWITTQTDGDGWKEIAFQSDSLREPTRVYGYMSLRNRRGAPLFVDSIELVRRRLNADNYRRPYSVTVRKFNLPVEIERDSTGTSEQ